MPKRKAGDWITTYLKYTDNTECPTQYHIWSAISGLAGALQRRVWFEWDKTVYPNHYILLVGPAGRTRKGTALAKMIDFFKHDDMRGIRVHPDGSTTKEQLVRSIANAETTFELDGVIYPQCATHHVVTEMITFLGAKDVLLLGWLTAWYDSHDRWDNETKTSGIDCVYNMCYNFIGGTAPDWMTSMLPAEGVGGGFTSRCILVFEEVKRKVVSFPRITPEELELKDRLQADIVRIAQLTGEYQYTQKAFSAYEQWYENQEEQIKRGLPPIRDPRLDTYLSRRQTHMWKLAMVLAASHTDELVIKEGDVRRAITILERTERKMHLAFGGMGASSIAPAMYKITSYLRQHGQATRGELMTAYPNDLDTYTFANAIRTLQEAGRILVQRIEEGGVVDTTYIFVDKRT